MNPEDSDPLVETASLRTVLTTIGYEYVLHRQMFGEFLDAIVTLADQVPSLTFHCRTDSQIELAYLGQRFCIRHRYDRDKKVSVLTSMAKASPNGDGYSPKHSLTMDKAGNLARPDGKPAWPVRGGAERAFYYLLLGE